MRIYNQSNASFLNSVYQGKDLSLEGIYQKCEKTCKWAALNPFTKKRVRQEAVCNGLFQLHVALDAGMKCTEEEKGRLFALVNKYVSADKIEGASSPLLSKIRYFYSYFQTETKPVCEQAVRETIRKWNLDIAQQFRPQEDKDLLAEYRKNPCFLEDCRALSTDWRLMGQEKAFVELLDLIDPIKTGMSTEEFQELVQELPNAEDREFLQGKLDARLYAAKTQDGLWKKAVDQAAQRLKVLVEEDEVALKRADEMANALIGKYSRHLGILNLQEFAETPKTELQQEFYEFVLRDSMSPKVFFEHRACADLMRSFEFNECMATYQHDFSWDARGVPMVKGNKAYQAWTEIDWTRVYVPHCFARESYRSIRKRLFTQRAEEQLSGSFVKPTKLYYLEDGLIEHHPTKWKASEFDRFFEGKESKFQSYASETELVPEWKKQEPMRVNLLVSNVSWAPGASNAHSHVEFQTKGDEFTFEATGKKLVEWKKYSFGMASDPHLSERRTQNIFSRIFEMVPMLGRHFRTKMENSDHAQFNRWRHIIRLNSSFEIKEEHKKPLLDLMKGYKNDEFYFSLQTRNCTDLNEKILRIVKPELLIPRKVYGYQSFPKDSMANKVLKWMHNSNKWVRVPLTSLILKIFGSRWSELGGRMYVNSPWLQGASIGVLNSQFL